MKKTVYDDHANHYDAWFEKNWAIYQSELRALKTLTSSFEKGLEIGMGTARFAAPLGLRVGLDPSLSMIRIATNREIDGVKGIAEQLPFKDSSHDLCLMVTVIFLLSDVKAAFKEAYRILKPGGSLIVGFVDKESRLGKRYERQKDESTFYRVVHFFTPKEVRAEMEKAGFKDVVFVQTLFESPEKIKAPESPKKGHGEGSFVVARGTKAREKSSPHDPKTHNTL